MLTILWLIRANQPIIKGDSETFFQDDWFMTIGFMLAFLAIDFFIIKVVTAVF